MKLEIDRTELVSALALAKKAIAGKTTRPILANVYLKAANDKLQIVGTDLEQMIIVEKQASVDRNGSITVPVKLLFDLCVSLPADSLAPISIEMDDHSGMLLISNEKFQCELHTISVDEYPPVPELTTLEMISIKGSALALAMRQTAISAGQDDCVNPIMKAVYVNLTDEPIAVGTDAKRMSIVKIDFKAPETMKRSYLVPIKAVKGLSDMLKNADVADAAIFHDQLICRIDGVTYITRLLDGKFPDYARVLPKTSTSNVVLSRKSLIQALKALLPMAKNNNHLVVCGFADDTLHLSVNAPENGNAGTKTDCKIIGNPPRICLNLQYVTDFLESIDSDDVKMEMTTSSYPVLFSANDGAQRCVIMPCSF